MKIEERTRKCLVSFHECGRRNLWINVIGTPLQKLKIDGKLASNVCYG